MKEKDPRLVQGYYRVDDMCRRDQYRLLLCIDPFRERGPSNRQISQSRGFRSKARGRSARKYFEGNGPRVLDLLDAIASETGATLAQVSLAWLANQLGIVAPIASATSVKLIKELLGVITLALTDEQLALLDQASAITERT